jgi:hypothetical protein
MAMVHRSWVVITELYNNWRTCRPRILWPIIVQFRCPQSVANILHHKSEVRNTRGQKLLVVTSGNSQFFQRICFETCAFFYSEESSSILFFNFFRSCAFSEPKLLRWQVEVCIGSDWTLIIRH